MNFRKRRAIQAQYSQKLDNIRRIAREQARVDNELQQAGDNNSLLDDKLNQLYIEEYREIKSLRNWMSRHDLYNDTERPHLPNVRKSLGDGTTLNLATGEIE